MDKKKISVGVFFAAVAVWLLLTAAGSLVEYLGGAFLIILGVAMVVTGWKRKEKDS